MVENSFKKHKVDQVLAALEGITFNFNKTVPLDLNMAIKKHLVKMSRIHGRSMKYDQFVSSIEDNEELKAIMKKGEITVETVISYAKTVGEIIWMKFDNFLGDEVFLQSDYMFNTIRMLLRHDLKTLFRYDKSSMFKAIGLFESRESFEKAVYNACQFGYFENQLIYGLCFIAGEPDDDVVYRSLFLLRKLSLFYVSESDDKRKLKAFCLVLRGNTRKVSLKIGKDFDEY